MALLVETVVWMAGTGLGLLWTMGRARDEPGYFGSGIRRVVTATLLVELFLQLQTFPLLVELLVQPVLAVLIVFELSITSTRREGPEVDQALGCLSSMFAVAGILFAAATAILVVKNWGEIDWAQQGLTLAMLVWLPVAALPFVYACSRLVLGSARDRRA